MKLTINGDAREIVLDTQAPVITALLAALGVGDRRVAVEVNERVIRSALHGDYRLSEGDVVEIVHFVGGG